MYFYHICPDWFDPGDVLKLPTRVSFVDFIAQGAESVQIAIEGMKPATLRAGLRRALKGNEDVKMAQRGNETCLVRAAG